MFPLVLPQVIPQAELEVWLGGRIKFYSVPANRAALIQVLQTYLNGGRPVGFHEAIEPTSKQLMIQSQLL
jgi:hypothetical protein